MIPPFVFIVCKFRTGHLSAKKALIFIYLHLSFTKNICNEFSGNGYRPA